MSRTRKALTFRQAREAKAKRGRPRISEDGKRVNALMKARRGLYSSHISEVANNIAETLLQKDAEYGGSWQRRGGVGAYMMSVRKSDRLDEQVKKFNYDIFKACQAETSSSESLIDTLKDQVGYGILILSELAARGVKI